MEYPRWVGTCVAGVRRSKGTVLLLCSVVAKLWLLVGDVALVDVGLVVVVAKTIALHRFA